MIGIILGTLTAGIFTFGIAGGAISEQERSEYMKELENKKVGKTIARTSETSMEVFTFASMQDAIEHPQEVTFDPNTHLPFKNKETIILLNCHKKPIEVFDGKEFKRVSDSELLTITDGENKSYVYLRFKEEKCR